MLTGLRRLVTCLALISGAALAGCTGVPRGGPLSVEIENQSIESDYVVVDVDADIVRQLGSLVDAGFKEKFSSSQQLSPTVVVGVGDALSIGIYEAGDGLFSRGAEGHSQFAAVTVDRNGDISLPYAGVLRVKGLTLLQIQELIVERLNGKAIQPQVIAQITENRHNVATLSGDVARPGLYPLSLSGDRLIDVISAAGGSKFPARETYITMTRGSDRNTATARQLLLAVVDDPRQNVYVQRGDQIFLSHDPPRYTVLGAVTKPGIYGFDSVNVNVLEAVASAGGLLDNRADASGLFVFRYEDPRTLDALSVRYGLTVRGRVPTIYRINMAHAQSYFWAQSFLLRDKDSVYVSNAKMVEVSKVLTIINQATASVGNVVGTASKANGL